MLQRLYGVWSDMDPVRRATSLVALLGSVVALVILTRLATAPSMSLLYGNLETVQAGEIVAALDRQNAIYEVRGNAIYVDVAERDQLRMLLAADGLPANSEAGYELLDQLSGFGTTSQMFDAAYWRAKEGELARTISASPFVRSARVHIASSGDNPFQAAVEGSASVFVTPAGRGLSETNAKALQYLVASAVAGLQPQDVAIIDAASGQMIEAGDEENRSGTDSDRAGELQAEVEALLEAFVGRGNAKVKVHLETETETESIVERRFDPDGRVAVSTDTQEVTRSSSGPAGGAVTVASNVPGGDAAGGGGESRSEDSETRERTNFEISETQREVLRSPGALRRLTVAVLVNHVPVENDAGEVSYAPRSEAELADLRELVQSAVGFRDDRGDVVTIKTLPFDRESPVGSAASGGFFDASRMDPMGLIRIGLLSIVALVLGLMVVRPALLAQRSQNASATAEEGSVPELEFPSGDYGNSGSMDDMGGSDLPALPPIGDLGGPMTVVEDFDMGDGFADNDASEPVERLKQVIEARQPDTVEILRSWLETGESQKETV